MAIVSVSAEVGCPVDETVRLAAARLGFHLITEFELNEAIEDEFGSLPVPEAAWMAAFQSILIRMATERHLLLSFPGCQYLMRGFRGVLRIHITAPDAVRAGHFMIDLQLDRAAAKRRLATAERRRVMMLAARFEGQPEPAPDLVLNMADWSSEQAAHLIESAAVCRQLDREGLLEGAPATQFEFDMRLALASHGIAPKGRAEVKTKPFSHPSEALFANLLDFYRIQWVYEPRSFPLQWNEAGEVTEAFTPDFFLPECDLYVELTTMKQSLVTRKNRKVKRLKAIYPHVNIQIFYQKDFQDLVFKYGFTSNS